MSYRQGDGSYVLRMRYGGGTHFKYRKEKYDEFQALHNLYRCPHGGRTAADSYFWVPADLWKYDP